MKHGSKANRRLATAALLGIGAAALALPAHAVPVDFAQYAQDNGEASVGEVAKAGSYANPLPADGVNLTFNGLVLTATGGVPYLDAFSGGKRGGLGVCTGTTDPAAQCDPSSDDNTSITESVVLSLLGGGLFDLAVSEWRDDGHDDITSSIDTLLVRVDGGAYQRMTFAQVAAMTFSSVASIEFAHDDASYLADDTGRSPDNFYLSIADITRVPAPTTLALLGLGLAGMGMRRRRQA